MNHDKVSMLWPKNRLTRSQDLPEIYHDCGQLYWATREFLLSGEEFVDGKAIGIVIPRHKVQDIDTPEDWTRAEIMYQILESMSDL